MARSLAELVAEEQQRIEAQFWPLAQSPRYSLLRVLASLAGADRFLTQENLARLEREIFPDTASVEVLREHWRGRVVPLGASFAEGEVVFRGIDGVLVPEGSLWRSTGGQFYFLKKAAQITGGTAKGSVCAEKPGAAGNLAAKAELMLSSSRISGLEIKAKVIGVGGGVDAETDEAYRARVIAYERQSLRTGKSGDWSSWAVESTTEVTQAWEFPNFDSSGAVLIIVVGGNQKTGLKTVANTQAVKDFLLKAAPLQMVVVKSARIQRIDLEIDLLRSEDTQANRDGIAQRLREYWQAAARPLASYTSEQLRSEVVDGRNISRAALRIVQGSPLQIDRYSLPTLGATPARGAITWGRL